MAHEPAAGEKGHLYKAEQPSSYNKGQTGKGASISGKVTAKGGTPLPMGDDHIDKLKN